jgi:hypothetical protein
MCKSMAPSAEKPAALDSVAVTWPAASAPYRNPKPPVAENWPSPTAMASVTGSMVRPGIGSACRILSAGMAAVPRKAWSLISRWICTNRSSGNEGVKSPLATHFPPSKRGRKVASLRNGKVSCTSAGAVGAKASTAGVPAASSSKSG